MKKKWFIFLFIFLLINCQNKTDSKQIPFPDHGKTSLPSLFSNNKELILSWVTQINDSITQLNYSKLENNSWKPPQKIVSGENWFVNWADYPTITKNESNFLSHFLKKSAVKKYSYDIRLNLKTPKENYWKTNIELHNDQTPTEHGFVTMLPYKNGFFLTWLDGRNTLDENVEVSNEGHSAHSGGMTLRSAVVSNDGKVIHRRLLDDKTCSCCQTTAAITDNGLIVLYRDRTKNEIRDISIVREVNGVWRSPQPIYNDDWNIEGCPVNGPKVDAIGNSVVVAWFTGVNEKTSVKLIFSEDGGANFFTPITINENETLGRVDVELLDENTALVSWMEQTDSKTVLKVKKVCKSGKKSKSIVVAEMSNSRKAGFPQMEKFGNYVYFAWTSITNTKTRIKTAYLTLDAF